MTATSAQLVDRSAERTHLFLAATLHCGRTSNPVRVRNLSETGALVEGGSLPPSQSAVVLRRGALEAAGTIAWSTGGKAGLSFSGAIDVAAWFPAREPSPNVRLAIAGAPLPEAVDAARPSRDERAPGALLAELIAVDVQIRQVARQLACDPSIATRHPEVKLLDVAAQRIKRMIDAVGGRAG